MCGIVGQFKLDGADPNLVERMAQRILHRGPNGHRVHHDGALAFGAVRLAIIDLSAPAGPIFNEDRHISVVFNGEIYNFRDLRRELEARGHIFSTATDTEVIVHGYEEWGVDVIGRLRGMFALCLWDNDQGRLLLARDRLGEKPLYYAHLDDGEFVFASEIKALFEHPRIRPAVNSDALPYYLTLGHVPSPETMFAGINKLGAGQLMLVDRQRKQIERYWQPVIDTTGPKMPYDEAVRTVRAALEDAVESRMISDVPVGAFLSGGMDSTAVVALMQQINSTRLNTFTVGFDFGEGSYGDRKFNVDLHHAASAARHIGTHHRAIILKDAALTDLFPRFVYQMDEPIGPPAIIPTAYITTLARYSGIPVLLTGEAGDELFMGYHHYHADQKLARALLIPGLVRKNLIASVLERLPVGNGRFRNAAYKLRNDDPVRRYLEWLRIIRLEALPELLTDQRVADGAYDTVASGLRPLLMTPHTRHFADRLAYTSMSTALVEDGNMRMDKMSMMVSVESRSPLEDHHLVELALNLPLRYKIRGDDFKLVFKDAVRDLLPAEVLERPKWGFSPPSSDWLRTVLRPYVETYLAPDYVEAAGICQPETVSRLVDEHLSQKGYHLWPLWMLLMLHTWHALYIDRSLSTPDRITPADFAGGTEIKEFS